ncbi:MAG: hypothetical protein WBP85_13570 [Terracidiphilus sp.]
MKVAEANSVREKVFCRKCGSGKVHRIHRDGFVQKMIYPLLGYYPWRCTRCGTLVMLQKRHRAKIRPGERNGQLENTPLEDA